jgi:hypothetical protein
MGPFFKGAYLPQNSYILPPFSHDTQALSKTCAFLLSEKKRRLLCMGRTFTANKLLPLNNSPKQLSISWESNPARVKASKRKIFSLETKNICIPQQ